MREVSADSLSLDFPSSAGIKSDAPPGFIPGDTRMPTPHLPILPFLAPRFEARIPWDFSIF